MTLCTQKCLKLRAPKCNCRFGPSFKEGSSVFLKLILNVSIGNDVATVGKNSIRPKTFSPMTLGPVIIGPMTLGPMTIGPMTIGPMTIGPMTIDPMTIGPMTIGRMTIGPKVNWS